MSSTLPPLEETNKNKLGNQMYKPVPILKLMTSMSTLKTSGNMTVYKYCSL